MQTTVRTLLACALVVGFSQGAAAQNKGWEDRAYINIGFGVESGNTDMTDSKTFTKYDESGKLTFVAGADRYDLIRELPVVDVATGQTLLLGDMERPYSQDWLNGMS